MCAWYTERSGESPDSLEQESQKIVSHHVSAGNLVQILYQSSVVFNQWDIILAMGAHSVPLANSL